jgi:hypothetical protein
MSSGYLGDFAFQNTAAIASICGFIKMYANQKSPYSKPNVPGAYGKGSPTLVTPSG